VTLAATRTSDEHVGTRIVVTGHGTFASGLVAAAELILGSRTDVAAVDFPATDTAEQLRMNLSEAVAACGEASSLVVLCDLRGGSPFNVASALSLERAGMEIAYGANLPLLLELLTRQDDEIDHEALSRAVAVAGDALGCLLPRAAQTAGAEDDDDWA
jgi:PTS system N-acetylgalactosamine-specific IIA component